MKINSTMQWIQTAALAAAVTFAGISRADDTDIYTRSANSDTSAPLVMFSLDFRSNLGSTICTAGSVATTYTNPNLFTKDGGGEYTHETSSFSCPAAAFLARNTQTSAQIAGLVAAGKKLDFFGVIRGAMKIVLSEVSGVKVGLMMNHHHINNCAGPGKAATPGCSNGGYIPIGFRTLVDNDTNGNKAYIFGVLDELQALSEGATSDTDGDGIVDGSDNCPGTPNASQADSDGDGIGDACDTGSDADGDGVDDAVDNCPNTSNADQADADGDGIGNVCEPDTDGDGVIDDNDNCPNTANAGQADADSDGIGDACEASDPDSDGDGIPDSIDACPTQPEDGKGPNKTDGCPKSGAVVGTTSKAGGGKAGAGGAQDHSYQGKELFFEFFRYLTGQKIHNSHNGWADYRKDSDDKNLPDDAAAVSWDTSIQQQDATNASIIRYKSPLESGDVCAKIFTINIMFQVSQQEDDSDAAITATKANGGMAGINLSGPRNSFSTVIDWLHDVDLADGTYGTVPDIAGDNNVTSFFIVDETKINTTTAGYARAGGTNMPLPLSQDPEELVEILSDIFRQILSVSTTFVAASIPVNVFNRAETEDELFLALFEANTNDFWNGNVKKLKIQTSGTSRSIVDANGDQAISSDGRIDYSALTPWTLKDNGDGSNSYLPAGTDPDDNLIAGADGRHVDRGGSGQRIPGFLPDGRVIGDNNGVGDRTVFTNEGGALVDLAVNTGWSSGDGGIIQDIFDLIEAAKQPIPSYCTTNFTECLDDANELIRYMRGLEDPNNDGTYTTRPWLFGDPLHSKPFPLNFGAFNDPVAGQYSDSNPAIYIAVASNDGGIRLLRNTLPDGTESGEELWTFIPKDTLETQTALKTNAPITNYVHPYGVDGSPVPTFVRASSGSSTIGAGDVVSFVVGQRRGGMNYYSLTVTNPNAPSLRWQLSPSSSGMGNLGYTFSTPQNAVVNDGSNTVNALIFAGGYDTNKDANATDDSVGNSLFIVNADTGALIAELSSSDNSAFVDSAPSDVTVADTDADGETDRVLFGDTGGNLWRADLKGPPADWTLTLLAKLGRHGSTDTGDRRFFHAPDLVRYRDDTGDYDAVIITSGNRANPLDLGITAPDNYAFMIKDRITTPGDAALASFTALELDDLADVTDNCTGEGTCATPLNLSKGWKMKLEATGEKGLAVPFTFGGVVFFTTYIPADGSSGSQCGPAEGGGRLYAVNIEDATPAYDYNQSEDSEKDRYDELSSGGIPAEVVFIPPGQILKPDLSFEDLALANRFRTYWQFLEQ